MLRNHFKIALRNLYKRKGYVLTNSLGLSISIASCMLIALYVQNQFSYDQHFEDADNIYRMLEEHTDQGDSEVSSGVPYSFVGIVAKDYPEVESATAVAGPFPSQSVAITDEKGQKLNFLENNVLIADSSFFSVFSFEMVSGDRKSALKNPNSIVLSESTAKRFFGEANPLGRPISIGGRSSVVTGVCEDAPQNSHFEFSYIVSSTTVRWFSQDHFNLRKAYCYLKLRSDANPTLLEGKFPDMVDTYMAGEIERINKVSWKEYRAAGNGFRYLLKPLREIHLDAEIHGGMKAGGDIKMLRILIAIAILIFIIACINFMNLATARSMERAKEVGIRKVMGSLRKQLIFQFLAESFIISIISIVLAAVLAILALPYFNTLVDTKLTFSYSLSSIPALFIIAVFIAVLAGIYPAFILSSFKPISVLKGRLTSNTKGKWVKNGLVVFQFWIAIMLISSTLIMQKQTKFLEGKDLGFDQEQLLVIEGTFHMDGNFTKPFLDEINGMVEVAETSGTLWMPTFQGTWSDEYRLQESTQVHTINRGAVGDNLLKAMDLELSQGEFFDPFSDDSFSVVLNESAVTSLGITDPIGKKIILIEHDEGGINEIPFSIKGVVKDFNYGSLHHIVEPLVLQSNEKFIGRMSSILVRIKGNNLKNTISQLESTWKEMIPDRPFVFRFVDEVLEANYQSERKLALIFSLFSGLSIFIAIIGLFALASYTISLRKKEIGIRKVVGASVKNILFLLSKEFTKIVVISFLLAAPLAWFALDRWLTNFAYRIDLSIGVFLTSGLTILTVTLLTISIQTLKAARANPVESLMDE